MRIRIEVDLSKKSTEEMERINKNIYPKLIAWNYNYLEKELCIQIPFEEKVKNTVKRVGKLKRIEVDKE